MAKKKAHTGNTGLFLVAAAIYLGLLLLFAWQTWSFVDWLFPGDQVLMKLLTVLCFDIMALLWACIDLFYRFASPGARTLVRWAWGVSFILSLLATIFYMVIESMFRFQVTINQATVNTGYGITIGALTLNILFLTFWLYSEWSARHPQQDEYPDDVAPVSAPVSTPVAPPQPAPAQPAGLTVSDVMQLIRAMQPPAQQPVVPVPATAPLPPAADPYEDLADSVAQGPVTSPLAVAPTPNGASLNGHQKTK